jgi:hypothetical protein
MRRFTGGLAAALLLAVVVALPSTAVAAEATLTEVVEAVHADQTEVKALKEVVQTQLTQVDKDVQAVSSNESPSNKSLETVAADIGKLEAKISEAGFVEGKPLYVTSTGSSAPATSVEVTKFGSAATGEIDGDTEALEVVFWVLFGFAIAFGVVAIWRSEVKIR